MSLAFLPIMNMRQAIKPSKHDDGHRADKAHLLTDRREDEVRLLFGHVAERRLEPVEETRAVHPARADGALRVLHLVEQLWTAGFVEF